MRAFGAVLPHGLYGELRRLHLLLEHHGQLDVWGGPHIRAHQSLVPPTVKMALILHPSLRPHLRNISGGPATSVDCECDAISHISELDMLLHRSQRSIFGRSFGNDHIELQRRPHTPVITAQSDKCLELGFTH